MAYNNYIEQLKKLYSEQKISETYIEDRFNYAIGKILHEAQVKFVTDAISVKNIKDVLEIAPGPARLTVDVGTVCKETCGTIMDVNANMLEQAKKRLDTAGLTDRWQTVIGDAFALPFDDVFQMVYSFRFIRHFRKEDREKIYRQIYDHLLPQGYLVFDAVNRDVSAPLRLKSGPEAYPIYDELYHLPQLKEELEENSFVIVDYVAVQHLFSLLNLIQVWVGPRSQRFAYALMKIIENAKIGKPLEWIILCQKQ